MTNKLGKSLSFLGESAMFVKFPVVEFFTFGNSHSHHIDPIERVPLLFWAHMVQDLLCA